MDLLKTAFLGAMFYLAAAWASPALGQGCECLNCPQNLPPAGLDTCYEREFILQVRGAVNDDLSDPFQGICAVNVHFQHNYVWSLEMYLISPSGDSIMLVGPSIISGFASTALSSWNIQFLPSQNPPDPDPGFEGVWSNDQLWEVFKKYNGKYHPVKGKLEDLDSGPVNGIWRILVRNCTEIESGKFLDFSLVFCDETGIDCDCQAFGGKLTTAPPQRICEGDSTLTLMPQPFFFGAPPDPMQYGYTYIVAKDGAIVEYTDQPDLTQVTPGSYEVCGLSFALAEQDSFPSPNGMLGMATLRDSLFSDAPPFCGDVSTGCLRFEIGAPLPVQVIDTAICAGQCFRLGDVDYCQSVQVRDTFAAGNGCDSIVELRLTVLPPASSFRRDTICQQDFVIIGNNFFNQTGLYQVTLKNPKTGCDSLVILDLFVLQVDAVASVSGQLGCFASKVTLSGAGSTWNFESPVINWTPGVGGNILSGADALSAVADQAAPYFLSISQTLANGKTCADTAFVTVQFNPLKPDLVGPDPFVFCEGSTIPISSLPVADQNGLGGVLEFYRDTPFLPGSQADPILQPMHGDSLFAFYRAGDCLDTLLVRFQEVEAPRVELLPYVTICNEDEGGVFNTLILFDTLVVQSNTVGSWANTDLAPVSGAFPLIDFQGVPGPMSYTFTWTSVKAPAPCANISASMEIFVESCACPSVATQPPGPFCQDGGNILLEELLITKEPGVWSLEATPPGANPAEILGDSLMVQQRDTGIYRLVFRLLDAPPVGCPDSATHDFRIHAPPFAVIQPMDTVCNNPGSGTHPMTLDLGELLLDGDSSGQWQDTGFPGVTIKGDTADFQGVPAGEYLLAYTTGSAQPPCAERTYPLAVTVLDCACPPLSVLGKDTLCNDLSAVDLSPYLLQGGGGSWSLLGQPTGAAVQDPIGNQWPVSGAPEGNYLLVYALAQSPGGACPSKDSLELTFLPSPVVELLSIDSVCNDSSGSLHFIIDLDSVILNSNFQGNWVDVDASGAAVAGSTFNFLGVAPGDYPFLYVTQGAMSPCSDKSFSLTVSVLDCSCPDFRDTVFCEDAGLVDLSGTHPSGLQVVWTPVQRPSGSPPVMLAGSTWDVNEAIPGNYSFLARWQRPPGNLCISDSTLVQARIESPPQIVLRPFATACTDNGPYGTSQVLLDTLLLQGPAGGQWLDIDQSGAAGVLPFQDFTGVPEGDYRFVYQTAKESACGSVSDTLILRVTSCLCPPVRPGQPSTSCNGSTSLELLPWSQGLAPGFWIVAQAPAGQAPAFVQGDLLVTGGRDPGTYRLAYLLAQAPPQGCPDSAQVLFELQDQPSAGSVMDTLRLCAGQTVSLALDSFLEGEDQGGIWFPAADNPTALQGLGGLSGVWQGRAPELAGIFRVGYRVTATSACPADTAWLFVVIAPKPPAMAGPDRTLGCNDPALPLGVPPPSGSAIRHGWYLDGQFLGYQDVWAADRSGTYVLLAEDLNTGCTSIDTVWVTSSGSAPSGVAVDVQKPLCEEANGSISVLSVTGGTPPFRYRLGAAAWQATGEFQGLVAGIYTLSVEDAIGCRYDTSFTLAGAGAFQVSLGPDLVVPAGSMLTLTANLSGSPGVLEEVQWSPSPLGCPTCLLADITVTAEVTVTVRVRTMDGCESSDELLIGIERIPRRFWAPTAFSPDYNGINDRFMLFGNEQLLQVSTLEVFDRWGNLLYQSSNLTPNDGSNGWDGTFRGRLMDPGLYVYRALLRFADGTELAVKGDFQLLR